jgi:4-amino-4-deoxy-L-arabinose transferase-like glycosyltransferase
MGTVSGWRLLTVAAMLALTIPRVWQRGMFVDGVTYAAIARNMAAGVGTFWAPSFSSTHYPQFFEQPPLGLGLQALAFLVLGDHPAVERAYAVCVFLLNGLLIAALARRFLAPAWDWVPVLLWLAPSVVTWTVVNNMLENTQALFSSAACYALLRTAGPRPRRADTAWAATAGLCVVAATLTKGPVGLFPLGLVLLFPLLTREQRPARPALVWTTVGVVVLLAALCLAAYAPSRDALVAFTRTHLAPTLTGARGAGLRGIDIVRHVLLGIALRMAAVVGVVWLVRRRVGVARGRDARFLFAVAAAASVPIFVSPLLAGHYFFPSTVFFALGFAALVAPSAVAPASPALPASPAPTRRLRSLPHWLTGTLAVAVCLTLCVHGPLDARDVTRLRSLEALEAALPRGGTVGACAASADDWGLHSYLQRLARVSIDTAHGDRHAWFLQVKASCPPPRRCVLVADTPALAWHRCPP